jgi:hypothetical protein
VQWAGAWSSFRPLGRCFAGQLPEPVAPGPESAVAATGTAVMLWIAVPGFTWLPPPPPFHLPCPRIRHPSQVLQMVDEGKLEDGGPSAEKVCMVAVCYHNSAVDHIFMQQVRFLAVVWWFGGGHGKGVWMGVR